MSSETGAPPQEDFNLQKGRPQQRRVSLITSTNSGTFSRKPHFQGFEALGPLNSITYNLFENDSNMDSGPGPFRSTKLHEKTSLCFSNHSLHSVADSATHNDTTNDIYLFHTVSSQILTQKHMWVCLCRKKISHSGTKTVTLLDLVLSVCDSKLIPCFVSEASFRHSDLHGHVLKTSE